VWLCFVWGYVTYGDSCNGNYRILIGEAIDFFIKHDYSSYLKYFLKIIYFIMIYFINKEI
jgi:hypothetical protein